MDLTPHTHKKQQPLFDDIVAVRDQLFAQNDALPVNPVIPGDLSESFAMLDPDLAALHKDMRSAAAQVELARRNGPSGAMLDMAEWRFESAESAYQTRLMEVRKNKHLKAAARKVLNGEKDEARRALRHQNMQDQMNTAFAEAMRKKRALEKRRKEEKEGGLFFYMMLGLWLGNLWSRQRANSLGLSNLQTAFFIARTA